MDQEEFVPDRARFKDSMGRYVTQSLFLENGYDTDLAVYTLTDEDKDYKGKVYPSLRRLYLSCMDPTEYTFATTYLWGWEHWVRLQGNKLLQPAIASWREELEVALRAQAIRRIQAASLGNFNAAKWIADGSWSTKRGRPSKAELEREKKIREKAAEESADDSARIIHLVRKDDDNG